MLAVYNLRYLSFFVLHMTSFTTTTKLLYCCTKASFSLTTHYLAHALCSWNLIRPFLFPYKHHNHGYKQIQNQMKKFLYLNSQDIFLFEFFSLVVFLSDDQRNPYKSLQTFFFSIPLSILFISILFTIGDCLIKLPV
jgi:hypothetical protein